MKHDKEVKKPCGPEDPEVKQDTQTPAAEEHPQSPETQGGDAAQQPDELELLRQKNAELNDHLLRTMAEFDNYKKRTAKEKQELSSFAKGLCIKEMLGTVDNFERALAAECKDEDFKKGMQMIFDQLSATLKHLGVEEIEALGKSFDPEQHNAIRQVEDETYGANIVCEVLQKGYQMDGKVIRHAMVAVANP
jgi:molecular chaperone GrpE